MPKAFSYPFFILIALLFPAISHAQSPLEKRLDFTVENLPVSTALLKLSEAADIGIAFQSNYFDESQTVSVAAKNRPLRSILSE